jgi:hypothetical protein
MSRILLFFFVIAAVARAITLPSDEELIPRLRKELKGQPDIAIRHVKKAGNRTIEFESFISQEGDLKVVPIILGNFGEFGRWALKGINQRPGGGSYYLQIHSVTVDPKLPDILKTDSELSLPVFHKQIVREFKMTTEQKGDVFTLIGETLPHEQSPVESASGYLRIYPAEGVNNRVWIYVHGSAILRYWIMYEALPERLMTTETGERIQIVLDNYLAEEERVRLKQSQSPTEKTAERGAAAATPSRK